jgi:phosphoribosylaminoimidazolecarboxamide formyltransferase/IMP cyclohydrolase
MNEQDPKELRPIRRALLSVSDKTGIVEFARELKNFGVEILSTGGTARLLRENKIEVREVADVTGFPEMLDGRVKTLHPRIHGGILAVRDNAEHIAAAEAHQIPLIDLVVIDLYPFEKTIARGDVTLEEAIEQIDIGGPAMIRSAAKNFRDVAVVTSPNDYELIIQELKQNDGSLSIEARRELALRAFAKTAAYDSAIFEYLNGIEGEEFPAEIPANALLQNDALILKKISDLRYGENPHQQAALYKTDEPYRLVNSSGITCAEILNGKEMSYNNYLDADAAWRLVCDFDEAACAIIKHTNPAGVGTAVSNDETLEAIYRRALKTDPVSAFGGIVAFNRQVDEAAARAVSEIFTEVVIAPDYTEAALEVLRKKKNLRVLKTNGIERAEGLDFRTISGGLLAQTRDTRRLTRADLKTVTNRQPSEEEMRALLFAWTVCKHTKSNAIVYARAGQTIGVGAGQMSRVDSVRLGAMRAAQAGLEPRRAVLASDAFFPFRDGIDEAAKNGVTAIIQPGGSVRDEETIAAANEHNIAMVFTGIRHFRH